MPLSSMKKKESTPKILHGEARNSLGAPSQASTTKKRRTHLSQKEFTTWEKEGVLLSTERSGEEIKTYMF